MADGRVDAWLVHLAEGVRDGDRAPGDMFSSRSVPDSPYRALIDATERNVRLVLVDGAPVAGDVAAMRAAGAAAAIARVRSATGRYTKGVASRAGALSNTIFTAPHACEPGEPVMVLRNPKGHHEGGSSMRRLLLLLVMVVTLAGASSAGAATATVQITKSGFTPRILTVSVGDTVTWSNKDTVSHQVAADSGAFTSPVLKSGETWSYTFTKADGYPYRDKLHETLRGAVNVNASGDVSIAQTGFQPQTINITAGQTVRWTNNDFSGASHQVVADDGSFTSPTLKQGATYSHMFEDAGTFKYHDGLRPLFTGTVAVAAGAQASIVLQASRGSTIAGGAVTLSGSVAGGQSGQTVSINAQPVGQSQRTIAVTADANGSFSARVSPLIGTTYQAVVKSASGTVRAQSSTVTVHVSPRVTLRRVGTIRFSTVVVDANAVDGNRVYLTKWVPKQQRYVAFASARLRPSATSDTVFTAVFTTKLRHVKLRAYLPQSQAGPGYLAGFSNFIVR
jgi:plastocyanin